MTVIFVTGMSGTGKSTVLNRLEQQGYRVVDTDVGGWVEDVPPADGTGAEPEWREDRIETLIAAVVDQLATLASAPPSGGFGRVATRATLSPVADSDLM